MVKEFLLDMSAISNDWLEQLRPEFSKAYYKKLFDKCYLSKRYEEYQYWVNIGMAIKNTFTDINEAFELFDYFSKKGSTYEGSTITYNKFLSFNNVPNKARITISTIYFFYLF